MELKLEIFECHSFFSLTTTVRLIMRTSRRERNCNNVSHGRISTADSIGFVCVLHAKWKTRKCQGRRKALQAEGSRLFADVWHRRRPRPAFLSLSVSFTKHRWKMILSVAALAKSTKIFFRLLKDTPLGLRILNVPCPLVLFRIIYLFGKYFIISLNIQDSSKLSKR